MKPQKLLHGSGKRIKGIKTVLDFSTGVNIGCALSDVKYKTEGDQGLYNRSQAALSSKVI